MFLLRRLTRPDIARSRTAEPDSRGEDREFECQQNSKTPAQVSTRGATRRTSQQSSDATVTIFRHRWGDVVTAGARLASSSFSLLLLSTRGCKDFVWAPTEWLPAHWNCRRQCFLFLLSTVIFQDKTRHIGLFCSNVPGNLRLIWCRVDRCRNFNALSL